MRFDARGTTVGKVILWVSLLASGSQVYGECGFIDGVYRGDGKWQDFDDGEGTYTVTTEIKGRSISNKYQWEQGSREVLLELTPDPSGEGCSLADLGPSNGEVGRCSQGACRYRLDLEDLKIEENFMQTGGVIYRMGFKIVPTKGDKGIVSWREIVK